MGGDKVTCQLTADNYINQVWVDGADVTSSVIGDLNNWPELKTLTFADTASKLAIKANDAEQGCANGGFIIKCHRRTPTRSGIWIRGPTATNSWCRLPQAITPTRLGIRVATNGTKTGTATLSQSLPCPSSARP